LKISGELVGRRADTILPAALFIAVSRQIALLKAGTWHEEGQREAQCQRSGDTVILEYVATPSRMSGGLDEDGRQLPDTVVASLTFLDVTERHRAVERIAYLARFDTLTGLPNRNQFLEKLE